MFDGILGNPQSGSHQQPAFGVFGCVGKLPGFLDIFGGDQSFEVTFFVDHQQFFDAVVV